MKWLSGKKTHMTGLGMVLVAAGMVLQGQMSIADALMPALNGMGLIALRLGIAKGQ